MMSCIFVFYISVFWAFCPAATPSAWLSGARTTEPRQAADPDTLFARREDPASARQAEAIWAARLAQNGGDFESAWKLARVRYWLGGHAASADRKKALENGIAAGRAAVAIDAKRAEGHFWIAANMGALAQSFGVRQGLKYRGDIRDGLLTALRIDPAYQQGSPDRALGRWYFMVPGLFGGSKKKSEEHLRRSLTYAPKSTASLFFLAETLLGMDRRTEAMRELQHVIDAPIDPEWAPEDREFKDKAQRLLSSLKQKKQ